MWGIFLGGCHESPLILVAAQSNLRFGQLGSRKPQKRKTPRPRGSERSVIYHLASERLPAPNPDIKPKTLVASHQFLRPAFTGPTLCRHWLGSCAPIGADTTMIDRNARARLGAKIRGDKNLTHAARLVANAALFATTDARTGRCQAYRARLAHEAGCHAATVTRSTNALQEAGYLKVVPTYGPRCRAEGGRWFRPRGANVLVWNEVLLKRIPHPLPSLNIKNIAPAPLPEGLAKVLERFGNAIADRSGLPPSS